MITLAVALAVVAALPGEGEVSARFHCEPGAVEVGEPFELVLEVRGPADRRLRETLAGELSLDESWAVLDERWEAPRVLNDPPGWQVVEHRWRLVSLEPGGGGERSLSEALSRVPFREDVRKIDLSEAGLEVSSVLGDGDAPQPLAPPPPGFGEVPPAKGPPWWWLSFGAAVLAGVVLVGLGIRRRRANRRRGEPEPSVEERLHRVEALLGEDAEAGLFELTLLVRSHWSRAIGLSGEGWTDEEWLERSAGRVPKAQHEALREFLTEAAKVKYAGLRPTDWALRELFDRARALVDSAAASRAVQPEGRAA